MSHSKYYSAILATLLTSTAFANINANNGFYVGGAIVTAGYNAVPGSAFSNQLFSGNDYLRPYIGYRFTDYFAVEGGYNDIENSSSNGNDIWGPDHYRLYSFDLAAKLIAPFSNGMSLFGKAGAGYTHQNVYNQTFTNGFVSVDSNTNRVQPLLGFGVSYNFAKNVASDLSFTHLFKSGDIGDINMLGLGLSYTFGSNS